MHHKEFLFLVLVPSLCPNEQNTAYKAANLFFKQCGIRPAVSIHIEKQIPSQAGLAGGSADAAAVLHGLNQLFQTNLTQKQLCEIGVQIGADVPFCICGGTMLATGIGENLYRFLPFRPVILSFASLPFRSAHKKHTKKQITALSCTVPIRKSYVMH